MENEELREFPNLESVLREMAEAVKAEYTGNLRANKRPTEGIPSRAQGRLADTVTTEVSLKEGKFTASLNLNYYWKYVEEGVAPAGKFKNPGWKAFPAIREWIDIKPVIPRPDSNGRIPSPKSLAYLITRKIVQSGTRGTHDLQMAKDAIIPQYLDRIEAALKEDVGQIVLKMMNW